MTSSCRSTSHSSCRSTAPCSTRSRRYSTRHCHSCTPIRSWRPRNSCSTIGKHCPGLAVFSLLQRLGSKNCCGPTHQPRQSNLAPQLQRPETRQKRCFCELRARLFNLNILWSCDQLILIYYPCSNLIHPINSLILQ